MAADKYKQMIRLQQVSRRQRKKTYRGLTEQQKKYIKAFENFNQFDKAMNTFWASAPRLDTGAVDWDKLSENEMAYFEDITARKEKYMRTMSRLEDAGLDVNRTMYEFYQINNHSQSY